MSTKLLDLEGLAYFKEQLDEKTSALLANKPDIRELKQAEYDALSDAEKNNGTVYFITDADVGSDATFATGEKVKDVSISDKVVSGSNAIVTGGAVQESIDAYEPDAISNQEIDDIIYN